MVTKNLHSVRRLEATTGNLCFALNFTHCRFVHGINNSFCSKGTVHLLLSMGSTIHSNDLQANVCPLNGMHTSVHKVQEFKILWFRYVHIATHVHGTLHYRIEAMVHIEYRLNMVHPCVRSFILQDRITVNFD